jgi:hypothetical protein
MPLHAYRHRPLPPPPPPAACCPAALQRAVVRPVTGEQLVSPSVCVKRLDLATMAAEDQDFTSEFRLEPRPGAGAGGHSALATGWHMRELNLCLAEMRCTVPSCSGLLWDSDSDCGQVPASFIQQSSS